MPEYLAKVSYQNDDSRLWFIGGESWNGEYATNFVKPYSSPVQTVSGGTNWKYISEGDYSGGAGIKTDGTLWIWGRNYNGALGDDTITHRSSPIQTIAGGNNWKQVNREWRTTAALKTDGTLWTWGYNSSGSLGDGTITHRSSPVQTVAGGTDWKQISIESDIMAAIKTDGTLWTWGTNWVGQLAQNHTDPFLISSPVQTISGGNNWKQVSVGRYHTSAIKTDDTLWLWGHNGYGQLGDNTRTHRSSPIQTIAVGNNWKIIDSHKGTVAAIKTDGTLWLWGHNSYGQLGDNTRTHRSSPIQTIAGGTDWKQVASGFVTAALKTDGTLWGWGLNDWGQLGNETLISVSSPILIASGLSNWKEIKNIGSGIAALEDYYGPRGTKYMVGGDAAWGLGFNVTGSLGIGTDSLNIYQPTKVLGEPLNWKILNASYYNSVGIKTDGTLWMWGDNRFGTLGNGTSSSTSINSPIQTISGGNNWKYAACSLYFFQTAAIKTDGTLWTWGYNRQGALGDNTRIHRSSPIQTVAGGTNWKEVSAGIEFCAAIKTDGTLWLWGMNDQYSAPGGGGQLGDGTTIHRSSPVQTVAGGTNWKMISCGSYHSAAIKTDGTLWTWGMSTFFGSGIGTGSLGDNTIIHRSSPVQTIAGGSNWKIVSAGAYMTMAVKTDGTLWTWGRNSLGTLGDNTIIHRSSPVQIAGGGSNWRLVQCSSYSGVAQKEDNSIWVWGSNGGFLGDGTTIHRSSPVQIAFGNSNWTVSANNLVEGQQSAKSASGINIFFIEKDYKEDLAYDGYVTKEYMIDTYPSLAAQFKSAGLWVWGGNYTGELGDGTLISRSSPVQTIAGGTNWQKSFASGAIKTDGTLWVWGTNSDGKLGDNTRIHRSSPVQTVAGGTNWILAKSASSNMVGVKSDGTLWVWGQNSWGQLGDNTRIHRSSPVQTVAGGTNWISADLNNIYVVGVKSDGTLWSWGNNANGRMGDGTTTNRSSPVQTVSGGTNWSTTQLAASNSRAALKTDGSLWSWGRNAAGQLGDGTTTQRISPVQTVAGGNNWKYLNTTNPGGTDATISAIKTDGTLWVWGLNTWGQLGDNTRIHRSSPVQTVAGGTNWKQVLSDAVTLAIKTDGTLWAWGYNFQGEIGDGTAIHRSSPVQNISGGTNWKKVYHGSSVSTGLKTDGSLWLWGYNEGSLGDGTLIHRSSPVQTVAGGYNWKSFDGFKAIRDDSEDPF
jgi:alpha-tubulin suppressor-like RCC1 family protein